jgi:hypothetical protein
LQAVGSFPGGFCAIAGQAINVKSETAIGKDWIICDSRFASNLFLAEGVANHNHKMRQKFWQ